MKVSLGYKIFNVINILFMIIVSAAMAFPFINVLCLSLEPEHIANEPGVIHLIPKEITFKAYAYILENKIIISAFQNSVFITITGAILGVILTAMLSYGISFEHVKGMRLISYIVMFTMMFQGGIIPLYMLVKDLHLVNSLWSLILPGLITAYNVILMRVFFKGLPVSLAESAMLDGCSEAGVFFRIVLPLSLPIIATVSLFYAVARWNSFFDAVMYISKAYKKPLQLILREMLVRTSSGSGSPDLELGTNVKMATVLVSVAPILCVYPFLQKYFTKGILLGAVKG